LRLAAREQRLAPGMMEQVEAEIDEVGAARRSAAFWISAKEAMVIGAMPLGYYDAGGRLICAGRVGSGMRVDQREDLLRRLQPLRTDRMPLDVAPPRSTRFGSPLVLSRVHWARPELVVEVRYLTWTATGSCGKSSTKGSARTSRRTTLSARDPALNRCRRRQVLGKRRPQDDIPLKRSTM
jgi:ATP-dependent DNA ligase